MRNRILTFVFVAGAAFSLVGFCTAQCENDCVENFEAKFASIGGVLRCLHYPSPDYCGGIIKSDRGDGVVDAQYHSLRPLYYNTVDCNEACDSGGAGPLVQQEATLDPYATSLGQVVNTHYCYRCKPDGSP